MTTLEEAEATLAKELGEDLLGAQILTTIPPMTQLNLMVRVHRQAWIKAGEVARDHLNCRWFDFLSAIDWMESPYGRQLETEQENPGPPPASPPIEWGILGGETRLQVLARVRSITEPLAIIFKADVPDELPAIDSWSSVYPGADWNERETWEMFGIRFDGHPGLRHIYLPTEFEGYPLRKDFPLLARKVKPWPGIVNVEGMPGEPESESGTESEVDDTAAAQEDQQEAQQEAVAE